MIMLPSVLLILACFFDLRSARFPNWLFVSSLAVGFAFSISQSGLLVAFKSLGWAFAFFLVLIPLIHFRVFGAGDGKLLMSFTMFTSFSTSLNVLIYSFVWGLLIGLLRITLNGQLMVFATSYILKNPQITSQKIPYTFAILLGWLCYLSTGRVL